MNYATPRLSLPGIQPPPRDPKQSEDRLESGPQNLCSSVSTCGCLEFLRLRPCFLALSVLLFTYVLVPLAQAVDFYVATNGSDSNIGNIGRPFATITKARDAARALGTSTVRNIFIRGGKYYNVAVVLTRYGDDSNLTIQGYPGETAVLYGGMPITNWVSVSNGWYAAPLPAFPSALVTNASSLTDWQVRMLLVDGVMASRSLYPTNAHSLYYTNSNNSAILGYTNGDLGPWLVCTNAEFQIDHSWNCSTAGAAAIDTNAQQVRFLTRLTYGLPYLPDVKTYRVYNIAEGMSQPGQFYYDRGSRKVIYWPLGGKDPNTSECIVPTTTRVFYLCGSQYSRPWGITFSNLTISVGTAPLILDGDYANGLGQGLVQSRYCDNITLDRVTIGPTAGHGYWSRGSSYCTNEIIRNCVVQDCGAGGIQSGASGAVISNNFVHSIGFIYPAAPGIMLGSSSTVINNDVFDCQMGAIAGSYLNNSYILNNHASNCMQVLRDMGAIYTWTATNNVIAGNYIEHITDTNLSGSWVLAFFRHAIYCDLNTVGFHIYNNVTRDVPRPLMLNACYNHVITNNLFIDTTNFVKLQFRGVPTNNIVFERNICYSPTNIYAEFYQYPNDVDNWNAVVDWSSNIFYSLVGGARGHDNYLDASTGVAGIPTNSVTLDPKFTRLSPLKISFQDDSPAPGLGILPLDLSGVGRIEAEALLLPASDLRPLPPRL